MHFLILGGSGRTGQEIIREALSQGHQITALVRSPESLSQFESSNLNSVKGSPLKPADLDAAFQANPDNPPTGVVVALNARRASDNPFAAPSSDTPPRLIADSVTNAIAAMNRHGSKRIVIMSQQGVGSSITSLNCAFRLLFTKSNMRHSLDDHNTTDAETRKILSRGEDAEFVFVRPVMLTDGEAKDVKVYSDNGEGVGFMPSVSRKSVARFMMRALTEDEFAGRAPVIAD